MLDVPTLVPKVYSYIRLSTPEQIKGDGARRQQTGAEVWAKKEGLPLDESMRDLGISAFTGDNVALGSKSALAMFIARVEAGEVARGSILVIEAFDRISRQHVRKAIGVFTRLLDAGIDVVTLMDGRRYRADAEGFEAAIDIALSAFMFGTGNEESNKKSVRLGQMWQEKRDEAARSKRPLTSLTPGWLTLDKETMEFVKIKDRVDIVVQIFEAAAQGLGKRTIAKRYSHVETWGRGKRAGRTFYESYVGKLLNDKRVLGEYQPGTNPKEKRSPKGKRQWRKAGVAIPDFYPQIISDELWWRVRHVRSMHRGTGGGNADAFHSIFRGLTFCGHCSPSHRKPVGMQYVMKGRSAKSGTDKLVCSLAIRKKCEHTKRYDYERLEASVLVSLGKSASVLVGKENERRAEMQKEVDILRTRIAGLKEQQQRWITAMEDVTVPPKTIVAKIAELDGFVAAAERLLQDNVAELNATPVYQSGDRLKDLYAAMKAHKTAEERRRLNEQLRGIISRMDFCPDPEGSDGTILIISFVGGGNSAAKIYLK
jgi:DNA invertase Pin-like site-specific DNA recombinase